MANVSSCPAAAAPAGTAAHSFSSAVHDAGCLKVLRAVIRRLLAGADEERVADAELVCTELVANALDHAAAPRTVTLSAAEQHQLHIVVVDGSPHTWLRWGTSRLGSHRGRGMLLVQQLTSALHVTRDAITKTVWAVVG